MTYSIGMCVIVRDESHYLLEWLDYYSMLGIEVFYIYDNNSALPVDRLLDDYNSTGELVLRSVTGVWPQLEAYNHCLVNDGRDCQWLGFLDIDEFLVLQSPNCLRDFLSHYSGYGGVGINWVMYGPGSHDRRPAGSQIRNYTCRLPIENPVNRHIKSFVQPAHVLDIPNPHFANYKKGYFCVNEIFNYIEGAFSNISINKARINHYFTRSKSDFTEKTRKSLGGPNPRSMELFEFYRAEGIIKDNAAVDCLNRLLCDS